MPYAFGGPARALQAFAIGGILSVIGACSGYPQRRQLGLQYVAHHYCVPERVHVPPANANAADRRSWRWRFCRRGSVHRKTGRHALIGRSKSVSFSNDGFPAPPGWRLCCRSAPREFWPRYGDRVVRIGANGQQNAFSDDDLKDLRLFRHLRELRIPGSLITDRGVEYIVPLRGLKALDLSGSKITDAGLKKIAMIRSLELLGLPETAVTDEGIRHLVALPRLKVLWLSGTKVTDRAAETIGQIKTLEQVSVNQTGFTLAGGTVLRKLLPNVDGQPWSVVPPRAGETRVEAY